VVGLPFVFIPQRTIRARKALVKQGCPLSVIPFPQFVFPPFRLTSRRHAIPSSNFRSATDSQWTAFFFFIFFSSEQASPTIPGLQLLLVIRLPIHFRKVMAAGQFMRGSHPLPLKMPSVVRAPAAKIFIKGPPLSGTQALYLLKSPPPLSWEDNFLWISLSPHSSLFAGLHCSGPRISSLEGWVLMERVSSFLLEVFRFFLYWPW